MNRRSFIKNTALAATMVGIAPAVMASNLKGGKKKKIIFVFRGVSYSDAENAYKKAAFDDANMHFQKVICEKADYSHDLGMMFIMEAPISFKDYSRVRTEQLSAYQIADVIRDAANAPAKVTPIVHLHHTE